MPNITITSGRLTRDPEIRYSTGAKRTAIASFSLAVDRFPKREGEPNADFFNYTAFGTTAEVVEKYAKKGTKLLITGRLQNNNYTNKDGQKVSRDVIIVEHLEFCEKRSNDTTNNSPAPATSPDGFMSIPNGIDDELPFA